MKQSYGNRNHRRSGFNEFRNNSARNRAAKRSARGGFRFSTIAVVLSVVAIVGLGVDYILQPHRFPMKQINIQGDLQYTEPVQISRAISKVASTNILTINIAEAAQAAAALPWVDEVVVKRRWPDTLDVYVNERVIRARWNDDQWLDQVGTPVRLLYYRNTELPRLRGPKGFEQEILANMNKWRPIFEAVELQLVEVKRSRTGSWSVLLRDINENPSAVIEEKEQRTEPVEFLVKLGNDDPRFQALRFTHLYKELFQPVNQTIATVDMRYPDGVSVQWEDGTSKLKGHGKYKVENGV